MRLAQLGIAVTWTLILGAITLGVAHLGATALGDRQEDNPKTRVDQYGDPLPPRAICRLGTLRFRGAGYIEQAASLSDGRQLLGKSSAAVLMWDATTGREIRRFERPAPIPGTNEEGVESLDFSFGALAVSPDEKLLAVATVSDGAKRDIPLLIFDIATGQKLAELAIHPSRYPHLAFVTSTLLVSASHHGHVFVWDVNRQRRLRSLDVPAQSRVYSLVASPDRKHVFAAGWEEKPGKGFWIEWEAETGKLIHHEKDLPGAPQLALSPDGRTLGLAMGTGRRPKLTGWTEMRLYSGPEWKEQRRWQSPEGDDPGRCSIAFAPDGKVIATGGADGLVRRWDAVTLKEIGPAIDPCQKHCQQVRYLDATTLFTFGFQATVKFWDAQTGKPKLVYDGSELQVTAVAYSPDGRHVAVGGGDAPIRIWNADSGQQVAQLRDGMSLVTCLQFSTDGRWLVSGDCKGKVRFWDWAKGGVPIRDFSNNTKSICSLASSDDGRRVAAADQAGVVRVREFSTGKLIQVLKSPTVNNDEDCSIGSLAFTSDGQSLFGSCFRGIRHWSLETGKEVELIDAKSLGHSNVVSMVAISPSGRWGFSVDYDGSICIWETRGGRLVSILKEKEPPGHDGPAAIALSRDGAKLAVGFTNKWENPSVQVWDLTKGQKVADLTGHRSPISHLAFSPDGRRLVSGSYDTTALVWDLTSLETGGPGADDKALAGLWKNLGASDVKIAYAAICQGIAAGDEAVTRLKLDLKPDVAIGAERIAPSVSQLDSDSYTQREKASQALAHLGPAAQTPLREALKKAQPPETRSRLEQVIKAHEAEECRQAYAVEILEMIGTNDARGLLKDLANGVGGTRLTREARTALERLKR